VVRPALVTDRLSQAGRQDVVILAMKAHQVEPVIADLSAVLDDSTMIVPMQNGIPWWYFQRNGGEHEGRYIRAVDPTGAIATTIDPQRVIGCVVYPACEIVEPGVIRHISGDRISIGEPDGARSERSKKIAQALVDAAHQTCPYSKATRGNIDVIINVV